VRLRDGIPKIGSSASTPSSRRRCAATFARALLPRRFVGPFGAEIRPARELVDYMLTGRMPAALADAAATR